MRFFLTVVVLTACCLLQVLAAKYIPFEHVRLELVIMAVVFYSLKMDILQAALVGVFGGLLKDTYSSATLGVSATSLFICAIILSWNRRLLSAGSGTSQAIMVASAIVLYYLIAGLIELLHGAGPFPSSSLMRSIFPVVIVNALIAPLCFRVFRFIDYEMA